MLSSAPSQRLLLSKSASNLTQQDLEQSRINFAITAKKYDSAKSETKVKINISCVNCNFGENRDWRGWIIGKGITGSLGAFLTRMKHKNKLLNRNTLLMRLLTIYDNCCIELEWNGKPDQDHILSVGSISKMSASLVLGLSYKEVEIVASSKGIIMEGVLMNAVKTVGIDGESKEWFLLNNNIWKFLFIVWW